MTNLILLVALIGQVDFYSKKTLPPVDFNATEKIARKTEQPAEGPTIDNSAKATYDRAKQEAKRTGKPKPVLYVMGDYHADDVAVFLASLSARNIDLPYVVDYNAIDEETRQEARLSVTKEPLWPFLQTVHPDVPYGPRWRPMENTSPEDYLGWLGRSQKWPAGAWSSSSSGSTSGTWGSSSSGRSRMMMRRGGMRMRRGGG